MTGTEARRQAILQARAEIQTRPVYLDTETTGLDNDSQIVEICILDSDGAPLVDTLVKPRGAIPADVIRIHGITNEMVADAPAWPDVWPCVSAALDGRRVAIYNAEFDLRMMQQSHRKHRLRWEAGFDCFCVMQLYARFYGEWNSYYRSFRWQRLENARHQCGLRLPNAHRAHADALLARAVLHYMAKCEA